MSWSRQGIVINYFKLEFERIGRLNKGTLGIIELMMNPVGKGHRNTYRTRMYLI